MTTRDEASRQVIEEHRSLRNELTALKQVAAAAPAEGMRETWLDDLTRRVGGLKPRLESHFELEKASGFFEAIESAWPNAAAECGRLLDDHRRLSDRLAGLERSLAARSVTDSAVATLATEVRSIVAELDRHETRETELFYTALEGGPGALD
jgi:hypothetical protein